MNKLSFLNFIKNGDVEKASRLVMFFYFFLFTQSLMMLNQVPNFLREGRVLFEPRWPLFWTGHMDFEASVQTIFIFFTLSALLACFLFNRRWVRVVAFIGALQFSALQNSFGTRDQHLDLWVWITLLFIWLPDVMRMKEVSDEAREKFLSVFWAAQALVLLIYSMSGMWKILAAIVQMSHGQVSIFSINATALYIATSLNRATTSDPSLLGPFLIAHPIITWLPLIGVLYVQCFAIWAAFKPELHRLWAFALIAFHLFNFLTLRVEFFQ